MSNDVVKIGNVTYKLVPMASGVICLHINGWHCIHIKDEGLLRIGTCCTTAIQRAEEDKIKMLHSTKYTEITKGNKKTKYIRLTTAVEDSKILCCEWLQDGKWHILFQIVKGQLYLWSHALTRDIENSGFSFTTKDKRIVLLG